MEQAQITPELYEQVKAMVLEEQRATNRAKAKARQQAREEEWKREAEAKRQENEAVNAIVEPFRYKYTPKLAKRYENTFMSGGRSLYDIINAKLDEAVNIALRTVGIHSVSGAYRFGELDKVIQMASEILDAQLTK